MVSIETTISAHGQLPFEEIREVAFGSGGNLDVFNQRQSISYISNRF